jgi:serine/threonine-protein kinase
MHAERLGKYELVRHLASGGMASVYLARISGLGGFERHVVLKTLRTTNLEDDPLVPMFLDEARLVATLHHQHIAQVFEVGREDSTYYLAMEYVHGETVRAVLETAGKHGHILSLDFSLTVVCAAAAALHHAHERRNLAGVSLGIVHRDVTPSNVIVSYDGSIKLIDFGIAKANDRSTRTRSGFIKGKAGYMAPEQVRGHQVDRRSDVFALGVLAYELTTQRRAFQAESQYEQLQRIANGSITPPSEIVPGYPVELEDIVMRCLEVDPDDRYPDAHAARAELERAAHDLGRSLGEGAVMRVLDQLYGPRPEPWLVGPGLIDYDITPSIADVPFELELLDATARSLANGSGSHPSLPETIDARPSAPEANVAPPSARDVPAILEVRPALVEGMRALARTRSVAAKRKGLARALLGGLLVAGAIAVGIYAVLDDAERPKTFARPPIPEPRRAPVPVVPGKPVPKPPPVVKARVAEPAVAPPIAPAGDRVMLHVITDPPDATVVLDGVRLGKSPFHAELTAKATAWLKVRRYDRLPVKIKVSLDRDFSWNVKLPPRR